MFKVTQRLGCGFSPSNEWPSPSPSETLCRNSNLLDTFLQRRLVVLQPVHVGPARGPHPGPRECSDLLPQLLETASTSSHPGGNIARQCFPGRDEADKSPWSPTVAATTRNCPIPESGNGLARARQGCCRGPSSRALLPGNSPQPQHRQRLAIPRNRISCSSRKKNRLSTTASATCPQCF